MGSPNKNTKPKILLVESSDVLRSVFRDVFEKFGYCIAAVGKAKEGLQILNNDVCRGDKMETTKKKGRCATRKARDSMIIRTTIYDLMETVIDVADPDENNLINEVTLNLLEKAKSCVWVADSANF